MKTLNVRRFCSFILLFIAAGSLLFSGTQNAFADPGVGTTHNPITPIAFTGVVNVGPAVPQNTPLESYDNVVMRLYEPFDATNGGSEVDPTVSTCTLAAHPGGPLALGTRAWDLYVTDDGSGNPGLAKIKVGQNSFFTARFGDGGNAEMNFGSLTEAQALDTANTGQTGPLFWQEVGGAASTDSIDFLVTPTSHVPPRQYFFAVCGDLLVSGNDQNINTEQVGGFFTQKAVGGSILPIETTSLLVAGLFTTPLMVMPIIGALAGIVGFAVRRQLQK